jgi:restriction system protein
LANRRKATGGWFADAMKARRQAKAQAEKRADDLRAKRILAADRDARKAAERERNEVAAKAEREERSRRQEAERERRREEEKHKKALAERRREVEKIERGLAQRTAAAQKERERQTQDRRRNQAARQTAALRDRVNELERLLSARPRRLAARRESVSRAYEAGDPDALADRVVQIATSVTYPEGFPGACEAGYQPEASEVHLTFELPGPGIVPRATSYNYVKARDAIEPVPRRETEYNRLYRQVVAAVAVRRLAELFDATPPALVDSIVLSGYAISTDRATGKPAPAWLVSVNAERHQIGDLAFDHPEFDPEACLDRLDARVSRHPHELEGVEPVADIDLTRFKLTEGLDIVAGLDSRMDLLTMDPYDFEDLVRQLFEAMGATTWKTVSRRDDGFDVLAVHEDPVFAGTWLIEAKRYKDLVPVRDVRALAGTLDYHRATSGVLVTTSWFGKASRDYCNAHRRIRLINGRELTGLLKKHLDLDVLIGLPKLPRGWERRDVS